MSIKNPTNTDLAHLKEGDEVDVSFIAVPFPVRLQTRLTDHDGNLRAREWTVRFSSGAAGPVLLALHSPLPPAPEPPPVGQCRRGPDADREIIADQVIPRYAMLDLWAAKWQRRKWAATHETPFWCICDTDTTTSCCMPG